MSFIVLPRKRRRPDRFELDYGHPLAQGLVFAELGSKLSKQGQYYNGATLHPDYNIGRNVISLENNNDYVLYVNNGDLSALGSSFAISIFVNLSQITTGAHICGIWDRFAVRCRSYLSSGVDFAVWDSGSSKELSSGVFPAVNKWHNITCCVREDHAEIYINSNIIASGLSLSNIDSGGTTSLCIGSYIDIPTNAAYNMLGSVADIMLWTQRALSPTEIAILANKTDPMLAGLIKEKRTAPIYFLPSVNHWELQIKVDGGEWVSVPNMSSEIAEYIKSTGLTSGTYYARIRKFTNGVPSDWEYANGVVYSAGGGGTPYSLAQDLLSSFSSIIGFSTDSVSSVSTDVDIVQDGKSVISNSFIVSQDSILRGSNIFVISQDGELSASSLFYGSQDSRTKSTTLWSDLQDMEGKISSKWSKNQDSNLSSSTTVNKNHDGSAKIHEYLIQNFDGKSTFLTKMWMNHASVSKVSSGVNFIFDSKAVVSSLGSYSIEMDALSKVSEQKEISQDGRLDTSFVYHLSQDSKSTISVIGYWYVSCDSVVKVHTDFILTEDIVSKISSSLTDSFDSKVTSSSKIAIDQDHRIAVKTALQLSFDSEGKFARTYEEFQEAIAGVSSGYAVIQDGKIHVIQVDFTQMAKIDLESFGLTVISTESETRITKALESTSRISIVKF